MTTRQFIAALLLAAAGASLSAAAAGAVLVARPAPQKADQRMKDEVARVGKAIQERSGCFEATYEIQRVLVVNGKHYYQVKLSEMAEPGKGKALPASGYIPVHNKDGSHVGQFSSIGC